jgi:hypothetical protein
MLYLWVKIYKYLASGSPSIYQENNPMPDYSVDPYDYKALYGPWHPGKLL